MPSDELMAPVKRTKNSTSRTRNHRILAQFSEHFWPNAAIERPVCLAHTPTEIVGSAGQTATSEKTAVDVNISP